MRLSVPRQWVVAVVLLSPAAAGAAAEPASREAFDLAVEFVRGSDPDLRAVALEQLRDGLAGEPYTVELAEQVLPTLPPDNQTRLLATLAGRGDPTALPGITTLVGAENPAVAAAALRAIAPLGDGRQVPLLVGCLAGGEPLREVARAALVAIQGADVSGQLHAVADSGDSPVTLRAEIFEILAQRRDRAAVPLLLKAAGADDAALRSAAMRALARLAGPTDVGGMVAGFLAAGEDNERNDAERAILAVCVQGPEAKSAAAALSEAYRRVEPSSQEKLLPLLARVGGPEVLAIVDALVADPDPGRRKLGLMALSRWPDASVADRILTLLGETADEGERKQLLGGLIRIAPLPGNGLDDAQKLVLVAKTLPLCTGDADRRRLLERVAAIRTVETLRLLLPYLDEPALAENAAQGVVELAHHRTLRDAHKAEFAAALDRVLAVSRDPVTRDRAERYRQGKTWERR